jgi:cob(I)alamin adenosyltransferase
MAIYTKTGDKGETSLASGKRVPKTDARIEAYGTVDELNSQVGLLRARLQTSSDCFHLADEQLEWVQDKLFNLGAALSEAPGEWIEETDVTQLERWIDAMQEVVPKQHAFVLPMGSECVCTCHVCRTVCRRAERRMTESGADVIALRFVNRLSDYFFVLSRYVSYNGGEKEFLWKK